MGVCRAGFCRRVPFSSLRRRGAPPVEAQAPHRCGSDGSSPAGRRNPMGESAYGPAPTAPGHHRQVRARGVAQALSATWVGFVAAPRCTDAWRASSPVPPWGTVVDLMMRVKEATGFHGSHEHSSERTYNRIRIARPRTAAHSRLAASPSTDTCTRRRGRGFESCGPEPGRCRPERGQPGGYGWN